MSGQKIGWRPYSPSGNNAVSTLLTSLYGAWNGDTTGTSLDTSIFGAWNGEASGTSLDTSIFAVYNADGNANDSKGTNHGTLVNGVTFSTGKIGQSFQFNGSSYVSLPNDSLNSTVGNDFSISLWVNFTSTSNQGLITNFTNPSVNNYTGWDLRLISGLPTFNLWINSESPVVVQGSSISVNNWYHIVITRKKGSRTRIYMNGSLVQSNSNTSDPIISSTYYPNIGHFQYLSTNGANTATYHGLYMTSGSKIDSVNIWTKELTTDEVTQLYNSGNGAQYPYSSQSLPSPIDSVGTNHGILMNGCTFTTGKIGNAFTFDGVNDYVNFPTNSWNSTIGTDFSVSLWVKFTSTATQTIISNMSSPSNNNWSGWEIRLISGRPIIHMWNNAGVPVGPQGSVISTNTWYHIVATRKKGSRTRIYMNGSLVQTDTTNTNDPWINGTYYPNIGHLQYASSGHWYYMANGSLIDSVNLWSKEISEDEVTQLYNLGNGTQYPFSSQTLPSTANQLGIDNATLMNGCTFGDGKIGKAFTFDGVNDYVQLPNNSLNLVNNYSINLWLYLTSSQSTTLLSVFGNDGFNKGFYIDITSLSSYTFRFVGFNNNSNVIALNGTGNLGYLNRWSMATLTVSGTSVKIYLDGTLASSGEMSVPINYTSTTYPTLGAFRNGSGTPNSHLSNGTKIDGLSVWQKELTQAEVTELYNSGNGKQLTATPIVTNGLVLNLDASRTSSYPGSGTTWTDISGSGNNGTMVNGPIFGTASGGVITFDGVNDYVSVADSTSLRFGTGAYTINLWVKPTSFSGSKVLIQKGSLLGGWQLYFDSVGYLHFTQQFVVDISTILFSPNQWKNIVFTSNGGTDRNIYMYVNGVSTGTYTCTGNQNYNLTSALTIGADGVGNNYFLNGNITNVLLYNRALSSTEITQNFNVTKSRFGL